MDFTIQEGGNGSRYPFPPPMPTYGWGGGPPRQFLSNKRGNHIALTACTVHHPQESQSVFSSSSFSKRGNMGARGQSDDKFIFPPNLVCMSHLTKTCPPWNVRNGYFSGKRKHLCSNASSSGYLRWSHCTFAQAHDLNPP